MKKRGQVTIFIILGLVVLGMIGILLFYLKDTINPSIKISPEENPSYYLKSCVEEKVKATLLKISEQGGYIENPLHLEFQFTGEEKVNISYLCYQQNYYLPCINQEPVFITHLKKEIKSEIAEEVRECFDLLAKDLDSKGYTVDALFENFEIKLYPKTVEIDTISRLTATKADSTKTITDINFLVSSRFYDLAVVVQEIVSQEARFCNFEQLGYMMIYPQYDIDKFRTGNSDTIYTVKYKESGERFRFAVRSCVIPAGF